MEQGQSSSEKDPWGGLCPGNGGLKRVDLSCDLGEKNLMRGKGKQRGNGQ